MPENPAPMQRLLSTEDAAEYIDDLFGLEVGQRWVERQIRERRLSYFKIGGMVRLGTDDLDKLLDGARVEATQPLNRLTDDQEANGAEEEEATEDEPIEEAPAPKAKPRAATPRRRRRTQA